MTPPPTVPATSGAGGRSGDVRPGVDGEDYLTPAQLAAAMSVSTRTVRTRSAPASSTAATDVREHSHRASHRAPG